MTAAKSPWSEAVLLALLVMLLSAVLLPRSAVNDCDAEAYLQGAYSLRMGEGYVSMIGEPLNHWPPGYSALLALFSDALKAAWWVNLLSLGLAVASVDLLAFRAGWERGLRIALSMVLGGGFLLSLAQSAKPDILTYSVFLVILLIYERPSRVARLAALCLASLLIPVKLIAMTFAPAILMSDLVRAGVRPFFKERWSEALIAGLVWAAAVGSIIGFNQRTLDSAIPSSHVDVTLVSFLGEIKRFAVSSIREGVATWQGSIRPLDSLIPYLLTLGAGIACALTLRPRRENAALASHGISVLAVSWALEVFRAFFAVPRLMGYGPMLVVIAWRPQARFVRLWAAYAVLTCGLAIWNHQRVWCFGSHDPVLVAEAAKAADLMPRGSAPVMTNALRFLDVYSHRASVAGDDYAGAVQGTLCWWVLPDSGHRVDLQAHAAPAGWTELLRQPHSVLFSKP